MKIKTVLVENYLLFENPEKFDEQVNNAVEDLEGKGNQIIRIDFSEKENFSKATIVYEKTSNAVTGNPFPVLVTGNSLPVHVGDTLYGVMDDGCITNDDEIIIFDVDNIVITKEDILLQYDSYDGVICTLNNLIYGTPYCDTRVFADKEAAEKALAKAKERIGENNGQPS